MSVFRDGQLDRISGQIDERGSQRLGEVASYALQNKDFRGLAFSPERVRTSLGSDPGLTQRLDRQDLGSFTEAELSYCERWAQLAAQQYGADDVQLVEALNREAGDRGPAG
jgi:hypothetical protein